MKFVLVILLWLAAADEATANRSCANPVYVGDVVFALPDGFSTYAGGASGIRFSFRSGRIFDVRIRDAFVSPAPGFAHLETVDGKYKYSLWEAERGPRRYFRGVLRSDDERRVIEVDARSRESIAEFFASFESPQAFILRCSGRR